MRKCITFVLIALTMGVISASTIHAETLQDEYIDANSILTDIEIELDANEDFSEDVVVYFDNTPVRLSSDSEEDGRGYRVVRSVVDGTHKIRVVSFTDYTKQYSYSYPEQFNTSEGTLYIQVTDLDSEHKADDAEEADYHDVMSSTDEYGMDDCIDVPEYKFVEEGYALIEVKCDYCPAVKSLIFSLMGEETYDIVLDRDNLFRAQVMLPEGTYREMPLNSIEFDEDACAGQYQYMLSHKEDKSFYGKSYELHQGEKLEITDLQLMMAVDGKCMEIDSNLLFTPTLLNNANSVMEENFKQVIEDSSASMSESESIAMAEPIIIESEQEHISLIPICIAVSITVLILIFYVKRRKKGRD